jgi:hypothetical protein
MSRRGVPIGVYPRREGWGRELQARERRGDGGGLPVVHRFFEAGAQAHCCGDLSLREKNGNAPSGISERGDSGVQGWTPQYPSLSSPPLST